MKKMAMWLVSVGCAVAMTAAAEEQAPLPEGAPKDPGLQGGGGKGLREHGRPMMMMEGGDFGEGMIMKALAPDSPIAKELGLSKEQLDSLKKLMKSGREEMKALQEKMKLAAKQQAELMSQSTPDETAVMKGVEEIGALRTQIAKAMTRQILAAQKVLTAEQRAELRGMIKARMAEMRERRQEGKGVERMGERRKMREEGNPNMPPPPAEPPPEE